jgi:hypothetical protein
VNILCHCHVLLLFMWARASDHWSGFEQVKQPNSSATFWVGLKIFCIWCMIDNRTLDIGITVIASETDTVKVCNKTVLIERAKAKNYTRTSMSMTQNITFYTWQIPPASWCTQSVRSGNVTYTMSCNVSWVFQSQNQGSWMSYLNNFEVWTRG